MITDITFAVRCVAITIAFACTTGLFGCGVTLRDKAPAATSPVNELVVENEYAVPVPLIQSAQMTLHYNRLVLRKDAKFMTNGLNIRIQIDELVSEGGTIATYPENMRAPSGVDGRGGGNIELVVGHATGTLHLLMRGEDGGTGVPGPAPDESLRGAKGPNGGHVKCINVGPCIPGDPPGQGGQGLPGFSGGAGHKGGDTGAAIVAVSKSESFQFDVLEVKGKGGAGGSGGAGGPGGFAGDPHVGSFPYQGPAVGPIGPNGPVGATGADGNYQKVCILFSNQGPKCAASERGPTP